MFEQLEDLPTISVIPESEETMDGLRDVLDSIEGASVQAEGEQYELTISCGRLQKPAEIAPIYRILVPFCHSAIQLAVRRYHEKEPAGV